MLATESVGIGGVRFPRNVGLSGWCGWSRAGVLGGGCAARAPAGAVTGSRVAEDAPGVQPVRGRDRAGSGTGVAGGAAAGGDRGVGPVAAFASWWFLPGT